MNPERNIQMIKEVREEHDTVIKDKYKFKTKQKITIMKNGTLFDIVHPNCITISEEGRLFVGDSQGSIYVCDVQIESARKFRIANKFRITHKELEGDQINSIIIHPEEINHIFVQSRDNCVRLIEIDSVRGPRVKKRFFGAKCKDMMVRCTISPDAQFLVSG